MTYKERINELLETAEPEQQLQVLRFTRSLLPKRRRETKKD